MASRRSTEKSKKATMKQVAEMANVSLMTVSRVFNQDSKVAEETRTRILNAVKELNYKPNISARGLSSSKSYILGFFYDRSSGGFIREYLIGTMLRCNDLGYHLVLEPCDFTESSVRDFVKNITLKHSLDGIVVPPPLGDNMALLDALDAEGLRYVRVGPGAKLKRSLCVVIDDYNAAFEMTEYLIGLGHKKIGFIKGDISQEVSHMRFKGFTDAMLKHHLQVAEGWVGEGNFNFEGGMIAAEKILKKYKVTAIFASNDDMASGVIAAANKLHIDVPEKLSIVGFDNTSVAVNAWPKLTTVNQPIFEMSKSAVDLLVEAINNDFNQTSLMKVNLELEYTLIFRDSVVSLK
jgi:LacI family transcriptional regulator